MIKKFLKVGTKLLTACLAFLTLSLFVLSATRIVRAASDNFYYFTVSVGETYETAGVNYHSNVDNSYVIYSTNQNMTNAVKAETTSTSWGIEQGRDVNTGFATRFVCRASLTNLLPKTTYYYQVVAGDEKSDVKTFVTGGNEGASSILFLTDTQSSSTKYFSKINPLVKAIESKEKNLNLVVMTGDIVDRGGYSAQWDGFFNGLTALDGYQSATIPGNHEYYHDDDPSYIDASIYNQFYFNPQNGPIDRLNSSYYFIYNDILFFMLDILPHTKSGYDLETHKTWFKSVVENNPTRWIVVGSHAGAISAGAYASDAKEVWNNWHETWEECQVDLAISGHEHIYIRKDLAYQGEKNEELGVTYLVGPAAGMKDYAVQTTEGLDVVMRGNYRGQVIKTQGSKMIVSLYDQTGTVYQSFTLNAKRNAEVSDISNEDILDSVSYEYNEANSTLEFSWTADIWGKVKKVYCTGDGKWEQTIPSCAEAFSKHTMSGILSTNNYNFTINFLMKDDSVISKNVQVLLNKDLIPSSISINGPKNLNVGETGQLTVDIMPVGADASVTWESLTPDILSVDENGLVTALSSGRGKIKATSTINPKVLRTINITVVATSKPTSLQINGLPNSFEVDKQYPFTISAEPADASKNVTWETSDPSVAQVANGKVYIFGYGTATITATSTVDTSITCSVTITVRKPITEIKIVTPDKTTLEINEELNLSTTHTPNDASVDLVWKSSDESVARVDANGKIKTIKAGTVTITVSDKDYPNISDSITITVNAAADDKPAKDKKGCGCKKSIEMIITLTSAVTLLAFVLRKKH